MIIGLSGYAGAGKNLVGSIIQYLNYSLVYPGIPINNWVKNAPTDIAKIYSGWTIKSYAYKLKQVAELMTGIPMSKWEDQEFKKSYLPQEWSSIGLPNLGFPDPKLNGTWVVEPITGREFLQKLGDGLRSVHPNILVNALFTDYKIDTIVQGEVWSLQKPGPNWIICDTRFDNEYQAIKARYGKIVRIVKGEPINSHPSEVLLDNHEFDYYIFNDGSIEELTERVKEMLVHFKLLTI